jgi:ankyrin repeat protein
LRLRSPTALPATPVTSAGYTLLMKAAQAGKAEMVQFLCDCRASVNTAVPQGRMSSLMISAFFGHAEIVAILLQYGAELNARNVTNRTPLMMAAAEGHRDAVAVLLEQGADIAMKDDFQLNALDHARRGQHEEVFQLMARSPAWVLKQAKELQAVVEQREFLVAEVRRQEEEAAEKAKKKAEKLAEKKAKAKAKKLAAKKKKEAEEKEGGKKK